MLLGIASGSLVVQKDPETLMDRGFLPGRQILDFCRDRTKVMGFKRYFDRLDCCSKAEKYVITDLVKSFREDVCVIAFLAYCFDSLNL